MNAKITSEKHLEKEVVRAVEKQGGLAIKLFGILFTGLPDRLILLPGGKVCFAEIKSSGKKLSPRQKIVVPMLERLGFKVWFISNEIELNIFRNAI